MKKCLFVCLTLCLGLSACTPSPSPVTPKPSISPTQTASNIPNTVSSTAPNPVNSSPANPVPQASQNPSQPVAVATGKPTQDLSQLKSLSLMTNKIYLDRKGEVVNLQPILKDAQGQALNAADFPLEWLSSRPADFAVDASGKVTALVEYGYSEITLRVPGTDLAVKQLLSVTEIVGTSSGSGSGSGSGGPTQENVNGTIEFQF